jgi:hypothetical protein
VNGFVDEDGTIRATRVATRAETTFVFGGVVRDLDVDAMTFRIRRVTVDYSAAEVTGTPAGGLRDGLVARVVISSRPVDGVVQADAVRVREIDIDQVEDVRVLLRGIVTTVLDAQRFVLNDAVVIRVTAGTLFFNGAREDVVEGATLGVVGRVVRGRVIRAERIAFRDRRRP